MDEGDVEPFEVIVTVQRPMRLNQERPVPRRIVAEVLHRQEPDALLHRRQHRLRAMGGIEPGKEVAPPIVQGKPVQVIAGAREPFRLLEPRHGLEPAVQPEPAAMVAADQLSGATRLVDEQVAAVRADIGQAPHPFAVAGQQQRFVDRTRQERDRRHGPGLGNESSRIPQPLPAAGKRAVQQRIEHLVAPVKAAGQGLGLADVGVDAIRRHGRGVRARRRYRAIPTPSRANP